MGKLINYALEYANLSNADFCFLIPESKELYGFYEKFGFKEVLYSADECNLHFSQIIEVYVKQEIVTYGDKAKEDNEPCGEAYFFKPAVKIEKINGLVPF